MRGRLERAERERGSGAAGVKGKVKGQTRIQVRHATSYMNRLSCKRGRKKGRHVVVQLLLLKNLQRLTEKGLVSSGSSSC